MKGYHIPSGYMGFIQGEWMLFPTETEYIEVWKEVNGCQDIRQGIQKNNGNAKHIVMLSMPYIIMAWNVKTGIINPSISAEEK